MHEKSDEHKTSYLIIAVPQNTLYCTSIAYFLAPKEIIEVKKINIRLRERKKMVKIWRCIVEAHLVPFETLKWSPYIC